MAEASANVKDALTSAIIAIDGVVVPTAPAAPTTGEALRQTTSLGKSDGSANYADPDGAGNLQVNIKAVGAGALPITVDGALPTGVAEDAGGSGALGMLGSAVSNLRAILAKLTSSVAVTGTFWQATQPVSGTVAVSNLPSTQPVSGEFTITDGGGNLEQARVLSQTPSTSDPALVTRGYATIEDVCVYLKAILTAIAHPQNVNPGTGQTRTEIDSIAPGVTMPVSGTVAVSTMTSVSQFGGVSVAPTLVISQMNSAWAQAVRSRIS